MKDTGRTTNNMERELKPGMKAVNMKVCMPMERKKDLENTNGQMEVFMKVSGQTIELMAKVSIYGKMEENTMENGLIMIWRELVFISGLMGDATKVSIKMIKSVGMVYTTGLMVVNMKAGGTRASSMALELMQIQLRVK